MKTVKEVKERVQELQKAGNSEDFFGHQSSVLMEYLDFENLKVFLKDDKVAELNKTWKPYELTKEVVTEQMSDYAVFGWGKITDHRGLSAGRTLDKMRAWLWLLGDDEMVKFANSDENYSQYGAPILAKICEKYKIEIPENDGLKNMIKGEPCESNCEAGCGQ